MYRDVEFTNDLREFFTQKAGEESGTPWLAVGSLVNPHDISAYPINWQTPPGATPGVVDWQNYPPAIGIPPEGALSIQGGINEQNVVELNPDGFPHASGNLPSTYDEILDNKPHCQRDFSLKWGLAMQTLTNASLHETGYTSPMPFQLQGEHALEWSLGYNQFYYYCLYLADLQLRRILQGLDAAGLAENTIVVFLSDHGDLAGSHGGMIQKWHNAYEETVRVPMIISSPLVNEKEDEMREIPLTCCRPSSVWPVCGKRVFVRRWKKPAVKPWLPWPAPTCPARYATAVAVPSRAPMAKNGPPCSS